MIAPRGVRRRTCARVPQHAQAPPQLARERNDSLRSRRPPKLSLAARREGGPGGAWTMLPTPRYARKCCPACEAG